VSTERQRLSGRDYKHGGRGNALSWTRYRQFGLGLALGLAVALVVYVSDHRVNSAATEDRPEPRSGKKAKAAASVEADAEEPATQYDFYDMLPKFEVVVPEKERDVRSDLPAAPVTRPGVYFLQAGSYRNQPDAERVREKLAKQGIVAVVQRVAVDADVWHRVRIGPISDLKQLNSTRQNLRAADIDAIVVRVGD
jgi:cell division protein FtsN